MKLTKGMKKALSLLLTSALVITGANFGGASASAADAKKTTDTIATWEGSMSLVHSKVDKDGGTWQADAYTSKVTTDKSEAVSKAALTVWESGYNEFWGGANVNYSEDLSAYDTVTVSVSGKATKDSEFSVTYGAAESAVETVKVKAGDFAEDYTFDANADKAISVGIAGAQADVLTISKVAITATKTEKTEETTAPTTSAAVTSGDATTAPTETVAPTTAPSTTPVITTEPSAEPSEEPSAEPSTEPTEEPTPAPTGDYNKFTATLSYVTKDDWADQNWSDNTVEVTKDGEYSISYKAAQDSDDLYLLILDTDLYKANANPAFKMEGKSIKIDDTEYDASKADFCFRDSNTQEEADNHPYRLNFVNPWNTPTLDDGFTSVDGADPIDVLADQKVAIKEGSVITVTFKVTGMGAPAPKATTPAKVTTTSAVSTNSAVTASAVTKSLKLSKKTVVVAPGKKATIKATVKAQAPATKAAVLTVSKKLSKKIGTVKVSGNKIVVKAAKKAVKGNSGKFTVKSGTKKATVTVKIQNKAKKVKAAKKSVTLKKGKTAKVTIKVTAQNKKKATTDTIKASVKKVAKVTKTKASKGKVVVTLKGKKKGTAKMTVKVGSKKVKVSVKVK